MCIRDSLRLGQKKTFFSTEMIWSTNYSIKHVTVSEKEVNMCGEEEHLVLELETEEELVDKVPISMATEEAIGRPTMVIGERLLLVLS